jgi:predicted transcriptional regulator
MPKEAVFTLKLEPELRNAFMAEAESMHRPASQIVREFMYEFIDRQREAREHDAWFRDQVRQGLREADDPNVQRIPHEDIAEKWRKQRAELMERVRTDT